MDIKIKLSIIKTSAKITIISQIYLLSPFSSVILFTPNPVTIYEILILTIAAVKTSIYLGSSKKEVGKLKPPPITLNIRTKKATPRLDKANSITQGAHQLVLRRVLVEIGGFEPPTSAMRAQRSPN